MFVHQLFKLYCAYSVSSMFSWRVSSCRACHYAAHDPSSWLPQLRTIKASMVIGHGTRCLIPELHSPHVLPFISSFLMAFLKTPSLALLSCCICTLYYFSSSSQSLSNSSPCAVSFVSVSAVFTNRTVSLPETRLLKHYFSTVCLVLEESWKGLWVKFFHSITVTLSLASFKSINIGTFFIRPFYLPIDTDNLTTKVFWHRLWERKKFLSQIFTIKTFL